LWCAAALCAAPALAEPSAALRAADPATPVKAVAVTTPPPAPAQPLELPTDMERARAIWQQANAQVAEFARGHIDILRWEAQNPGTPATETPASTGPTLDVAEALRLSLRQRPALFAHAGLNALERAEVQRAYVAHVQAVHSAWTQAVAARHSLRLMRGPARAAGVHHRRRRGLDALGAPAHGARGSGQLLEGLALGGECRHEGADLGVGERA
jgi:hypothetical protein